VRGIPGDIDPDLAFIVAHWHDLKPDSRRMVLDTVRSEIHTPDADARREACVSALTQAQAEDREQDRQYPGAM
jgi:hypothetical protein